MEFRVRFAETDQMGVAHHSAYVVWFEAARVEWLRERGMSYREFEEGGLSLAVSKVEVSYRGAAYFDDLLVIGARLVSVRSRHVRFEYELRRAGTLLATAATEHVPTDRTGRAKTLPAAWLEPLTRMSATAR